MCSTGELGDVVVPGVVPTLSATPGRITNLGPPLGNATDEVMRELLGLAAAETRSGCASRRSSDGRTTWTCVDPRRSRAVPLAGIRVIDVATVIAAPYCATMLGEFGADVLKVEHPVGGDALRRFGTPTDARRHADLAERSAQQELGDARPAPPEGVELFKELIAQTDVLCENFRTGTLEKWGLGWDVLHEINPRLIMLRVTGYGQTGPYSDRPGFARVAHAVGGIAYLAGMPKGTPVTPGSTTLGDYMTGPLRLPRRADGAAPPRPHRRGPVRRCGAVRVGVPLHRRAGAGLRACTAPCASGTGSSHNDFACPHGHFPTKDGKWVAISCATDKLFARLAKAMGRPELAAVQHLRRAEDAARTPPRRERDRARLVRLAHARGGAASAATPPTRRPGR